MSDDALIMEISKGSETWAKLPNGWVLEVIEMIEMNALTSWDKNHQA
jgi:hypothetical protein